MSRTYTATGIVLKGMAMGESDRLVTILSPDRGLLRAVVPGARKPKSSLRGRLELFVVNDLLVVQGRSLDRVIQAETRESFAPLSRDLAKLAIAQYWAELVLTLAQSDASPADLYHLLIQHLTLLTHLNPTASLDTRVAQLTQGVIHLLHWGGIAPQWDICCVTGAAIAPPLDNPRWRVGIDFDQGGLVLLPPPAAIRCHAYLTNIETYLLQQLSQTHPDLIASPQLGSTLAWRGIERILRQYTQYHFGNVIRSAALLDTLFIEEF